MYQQLRIYKNSKQSLVEKLKNKELNQQILEQENQELHAEINTLKKKLDEFRINQAKNQKWIQNS